MRLDIAAGTAVRFEPGQTRDVQLVALAGKRVVYGFRGEIQGKLCFRSKRTLRSRSLLPCGEADGREPLCPQPARNSPRKRPSTIPT
jgi:hypothetical protein